MVDLKQKPAVVNIEVAIDDSFSTLIDLSIDLSGYTITAFVDNKDGKTSPTEFTVVDTNLSLGQSTISLTKAQNTALGLGQHNWRFHYEKEAIARRGLAGMFTVVYK